MSYRSPSQGIVHGPRPLLDRNWRGWLWTGGLSAGGVIYGSSYSGFADEAAVSAAYAAGRVYYINDATGNDGNAGGSAAPWKTLNAITTKIAALSAGQHFVVFVAAGTYTGGQTIYGTTALKAIVSFAPGCTVQGVVSVDDYCVDAGGNLAIDLIANGLIIEDYDTGTGNGLSTSDSGILRAFGGGGVVRRCQDGVTAHGDSVNNVYDWTITDCYKTCYACVSASQLNAYRCTFEGRAAAILGVGELLNTSEGYFEDCVFTPAANGQLVGLAGATVVRGRIGTLTTSVVIDATSQASISDTFVNAWVYGLSLVEIDECFGYLSTRARGGGNIGINKSVLISGAAGYSDSVLFSNFDPGAHGSWNVVDTILTGFGTAVGLDFGATDAGYFVAAANSVNYCCLFGNTTNFDADLVTAGANITTGNITTNPLLAAGGTTNKSDWGYQAGSPCIGAGSAGGNIGFAAGPA